MNNPNLITENQKDAQSQILLARTKMPPARVLNLIAKVFPRSFSKQRFSYWVLQIIFLNILIVLPGLLVSLLLDEIKIWPSNIYSVTSWMAGIEMAVFGFLLAYLLFQLILKELACYTVYKITAAEDVTSLVYFCNVSASFKFGYILVGSLLWTFWSYFSMSEYPGVGLSLVIAFTGGFVGLSLQSVIWAIALVNRLMEYKYELSKYSPVNSEVVARLSRLLNQVLYLTSIFFVVLTLLVSSGLFGSQINRAFAGPLAMVGWGMILVQFIVYRSALTKIAEKEYWLSLNRLHAQMNVIQLSDDLSNKEVSEKFMRLAEVHERIRIDRPKTFDQKSVLNLISQLMLPLLGLILGNIEKLESYLK